MAHTKSAGSTKLGRDSASKRLGVKINHNQAVKAGQIILRQRGTRYLLGKNVKKGKDDTIYAAINGVVQFKDSRRKRFDGSMRKGKMISVLVK
ncbi:MAG: 50S ribosomal protein L27 [Candidatus Harrisonbacteria bacterium CG10_big_fil_rev_8_21_14_0_10_44_23]|uniref:Large ribosomal subunit protein bL27 n=1 Tax=Candidatus Harrisonbacteria bacterium CG10_big_fil_rev_8_21_14_0_10_44_23 TaxID=1974585 RepID=A0A2H0UQI1_9BACT|nr:MAG: 50S ribosomal protein L27 [Candidatus Harrisonbacteria bacterium CG10_big_fil_rev_8_21_14_0_10_44_23]